MDTPFIFTDYHFDRKFEYMYVYFAEVTEWNSTTLPLSIRSFRDESVVEFALKMMVSFLSIQLHICRFKFSPIIKPMTFFYTLHISTITGAGAHQLQHGAYHGFLHFCVWFMVYSPFVSAQSSHSCCILRQCSLRGFCICEFLFAHALHCRGWEFIRSRKIGREPAKA